MICGQCESGSQRPTATRVAGFHAWRKLGRFVKKGAKGIAIFAPCVYRKNDEREDADSPTVKRLRGFKVCWVFDQCDTDGEPSPTLITSAAQGGEALLPQLEAAASRLNVTLDRQEIKEHGVEGYSTGGRIVVRAGLSTAAKCAVVVHELCHNADFRFMPSRSEFGVKDASDRPDLAA
jgi:dienelactone hydrolase